ncbi:MAG: hypothetical protein LPK85_14595 [Gammaproteobacteria bacterium]|nr:hypothetical protein [Gammaproteobacteria bacterium]
MPAQDSRELIVVRYRPGYRLRRVVILLGVLVLGVLAGMGFVMLAGGWVLPWWSESSVQEGAVDTAPVRRFLRAGAEEDNLRRQLAVLERGQRIDRQALEQAKQTLATLESELAQARAEAALYKAILSPEAGQAGLQVYRADIVPSSTAAGTYTYRIVLAQFGDVRQDAQGRLQLSIEGMGEGGQPLPLSAVSSPKMEDIPFQFRYFQDISGQISLPEGFVPRALHMVLRVQGQRAPAFEQRVDWPTTTETPDAGQKEETATDSL